jgi:hypothetical protein
VKKIGDEHLTQTGYQLNSLSEDSAFKTLYNGEPSTYQTLSNK